MSLRTQLSVLTAVIVAIALVFGTVFLASMARLDSVEVAQSGYAEFRREITSLRDLIFQYVMTREPVDAARVADQAAFLDGEASRDARSATDPRERAELERIRATLADMGASARRLSLGVSDQPGPESRAELERGLYAQATDVAAGVEQLYGAAESVTEAELERVRLLTWVSIVVAFVLTFGAIVRISGRLRKGLRSLTRGLGAFAAGDFEARIDLAGRDELSQAAEGFNHMAELVSEHDRELSDLNRRLVAAARTKSEFTANMSHDLRTPLNSIIGFSGVLLSGMAGPLEEEQMRQLRFINRSGEHLKSLVDDILDLSRLESIGWEPRPRRFSLEALVQDIVDTVHSNAAAKRVKVISVVEPEGAEVVADELGCRRILMNLTGNAVKFTQKGSVTVRARLVEDTLVFEVEDTGPGIAPEDSARIFEPFEQVGSKEDARAKAEGSGLGLAIVRRIAASLGGTVSLVSEPGKGSLFSVTLPTGATAVGDKA
jgi:signal transduction histidine kinase